MAKYSAAEDAQLPDLGHRGVDLHMNNISGSFIQFSHPIVCIFANHFSLVVRRLNSIQHEVFS